MLVPTSKALIHNQKSKKNKIDNYNTIKIDFRKMANFPSSSTPYTQCQHCPGIVISKENLPKQIDGCYKWKCAFCHKENITEEYHVAPNNLKYPLQKNVANEILPPILLFVVDCSGSMEESVCVYSQNKMNEEKLLTLSSDFKEIFSKSYFCKKQQQFLKQFQEQYLYHKNKEKYKKYQKIKGDQYQSKIAFFMAIIENYLQQNHQQNILQEYRVGFVFFSKSIYVLKAAVQRTIPVFVHEKPQTQEFPYKFSQLNFYNYDQLFNKGKSFDRYFGDSLLKNLDLEKVAFQNLKISQETALGPALVFSLGILSVHDIGSRIILVSDEVPNFGLLSENKEQKNTFYYEKIIQSLREKKTTVAVLNFPLKTEIRKREDPLYTQFYRKFVKIDANIVTEIKISLKDDVNDIHILNLAKKEIKSILLNNSFGEKVDIDILVDNSNVKVENFKYDFKDYQSMKFIGLGASNWLSINVAKVKQQIEYLFPVVTQLVIKYIDVISKEKCLFMSYTSQKIVKYGAENHKTIEIQLNNENLKEIDNLEKAFMIEKTPSLSSQATLKSYKMYSISEEENEQEITYQKFLYLDEQNSDDDRL